jgi:hypothetical protein
MFSLREKSVTSFNFRRNFNNYMTHDKKRNTDDSKEREKHLTTDIT